MKKLFVVLAAFILGIIAGFGLKRNYPFLRETSRDLIYGKYDPLLPIHSGDIFLRRPVKEGKPVLGPQQAAIVLIEFGDYTCEGTRKWHTEVFNRLFEQYGGTVRYSYRHFPLEGRRPKSLEAAIAATCAGEQNRYWEYHNALLSGTYDSFLDIAEYLELNVEQFRACLRSPEARTKVMKDYLEGYALGVRGTPTFFINGIPVVGAQDFEVFRRIIDMELQK